MKNMFKKIAAMSAAVMMMVSVASMGASASEKKVSLYVSSNGSHSIETCTTKAKWHNYYSTNFSYESYSSKNVKICDKSYVIKGKKKYLIINRKEDVMTSSYLNRHESFSKLINKGNKIFNQLTISPGKGRSAGATGYYYY